MNMCNHDIGTEYWTLDENGLGFCSTISIEDAVRNHIWEMKYGKWLNVKPHGPIVDIKIVHRRIEETVIKFSEQEERP